MGPSGAVMPTIVVLLGLTWLLFSLFSKRNNWLHSQNRITITSCFRVISTGWIARKSENSDWVQSNANSINSTLPTKPATSFELKTLPLH